MRPCAWALPATSASSSRAPGVVLRTRRTLHDLLEPALTRGPALRGHDLDLQPGRVGQGTVGVDAQELVDAPDQVGGIDRAGGHLLTPGVRGADHLAAFKPPPGH